MDNKTMHGAIAVFAAPVLYAAFVAVAIAIAVGSALVAVEVWRSGIVKLFLEGTNVSASDATRRGDSFLVFILAVLCLVAAAFSAMGLTLPFLAWRDRWKRRHCGEFIPLRKLPWLADALRKAKIDAGKQKIAEVRLDVGLKAALGYKPTVWGGISGERELSIGVTGLYHFTRDEFADILAAQAVHLSHPVRERVRASLAALCDFFARMAAIREARSLDGDGEPEFPPSLHSPLFLIYPWVAMLLHMWLSHVLEEMSPGTGGTLYEIGLRKTRLVRARSVRALRSLVEADIRDQALPENLPLFLLSGAKLERMRMGTFQADVWELVPADSMALEIAGFDSLCRTASKKLYETYGLDGIRTLPVDECIEHVNELTKQDPLFVKN